MQQQTVRNNFPHYVCKGDRCFYSNGANYKPEPNVDCIGCPKLEFT